MPSSFLDLPPTLHADAGEFAALGSELHAAYSTATPFPHVKIDDFLPPALLEQVLGDTARLPKSEASFDRPQEQLKNSYSPALFPEGTRNLFWFFNSRPFLAFLERMTGIPGLIGDPYYVGGGVHEVKTGGHLDIHADFNHLPKLNLQRRLNMLIYLNRDWKTEYGGQFEIWDTGMKQCVHAFDPAFNRCVVFTTDSESYHGNPRTVAHPQGRSRLSMALYYYTATWDGTQRNHTTQFRARPGSKDRFDWRVRVAESLQDVTPPVLFRLGRRAIRRLSS